MEKKYSTSSKQVGSSSSSTSSFVTTLFGPESSYSSSGGSSSNVLGSIFGPPPMGGVREGQVGNMRHHGAPGNGNKGEKNKNKSNYQREKSDLGFYSNSIYYGGQDDVSPTTRNTEPQLNTHKKDDEPNSGVDTRGNWWQGSYYY